ncbi:hypothetical protein AX761_21705 [Rhizobium sp. 58]|nr:hypothetical protein AX761_21705 [Rhizobium sp. 58]
MTVASQTNRSGPYTGNGVTTVYDYDFKIDNAAHVQVIKADAAGVETILVLNTDYTVTGVGDAAGGTIVLAVALPALHTLTNLREVPFTQETDLENQGAYYAETVERSFDLAAMRDQQLAEKLGRAIRLPASSSGEGFTITPGTKGQVPLFDEYGNLIPSEASGTGNMAREFYDPNSILKDAFNPKFFVGSGAYFGASGDGVTDDTLKYAQAEAAYPSIFLPTGSTFFLGATPPAKPVHGPGSIKVGSVTLGGYQMQVDAYRSTIFLTPSDYTDLIGFPSAGYNKGVLIGAGAVLSGVMNRFVAIGAGVLQRAVSIDRFNAVGNGCMQYSRFGNRIDAFGSANCQWLAADKATVILTHPWWLESGGFTPGQVGWDFQGLETRNPGIGALIDAFTGYATAQGDVAKVCAFGRDAIGGNVIANQDAAFGYGALAGFATQGNAAFGVDTFNQAVFQTQSSGFGWEAGRYWQQGTRNSIFGRGSAHNVVRGSYNLVLGSFAGAIPTDMTDNVLIGYAAANTIVGTSQTDIFVLGNRNRPFLITGDFATGAVGIGLAPSAIKCVGAGLHIYSSSFGAVEAASAALDDLILETGSNTGITLRSAVGALGQVGFARPGQSSRGVIQYDHANDAFNHNIAGTARLQIGAGIIAGAGLTFKGVGTLNVVSDIYRNDLKMIGARASGWSVDTGTAKRTANATYSGTAEAAYTQATIQTLMNAVRDATQTMKALKDDLHAANANHGLLAA